MRQFYRYLTDMNTLTLDLHSSITGSFLCLSISTSAKLCQKKMISDWLMALMPDFIGAAVAQIKVLHIAQCVFKPLTG
jgi:succinylglutamate desuccinylase